MAGLRAPPASSPALARRRRRLRRAHAEALGYRDVLRAEGIEVLEVEGQDLVDRIVPHFPVKTTPSEDTDKSLHIQALCEHFGEPFVVENNLILDQLLECLQILEQSRETQRLFDIVMGCIAGISLLALTASHASTIMRPRATMLAGM